MMDDDLGDEDAEPKKLPWKPSHWADKVARDESWTLIDYST